MASTCRWRGDDPWCIGAPWRIAGVAGRLMPVLRDIGTLATCRPAGGQDEIHLVEDAALAWEEGEIRWVGPEAELPPELGAEIGTGEDGGSRQGTGATAAASVLDAGGGLVVPGLVDCHTHLAFGGWRADEFRRRLAGESYREIAEAGGGIASTVRRTREASEEELTARAGGFLREMAALGVTSVECKSGYGLTLEEERKLLRVYRRLEREGPQRITATLLAHIVPPERETDRAAYVDEIVERWIPGVAADGLAAACDVFLEEGAFDRDEARRILAAGREHGLRPRIHADQLSDGGGATLAAELGAASADHLERTSASGVAALAGAGTVAVTLPLAALYLDQPSPPARALIEAGVPVAVATDFNPGSAPSFDLPLAMMLACTRQRMTPAEALKGATIHAARAAGLEEVAGSLEEGKPADFAVIDAPDVDHWMYHFRPNACRLTVVGGEVVWRAPGRPGEARARTAAAR